MTSVKIAVLAVFIGYLAVACWGTTKIQEGLERRRMVLYDSYAVEFFDREDLYFREYPYRIQVKISWHIKQCLIVPEFQCQFGVIFS